PCRTAAERAGVPRVAQRRLQSRGRAGRARPLRARGGRPMTAPGITRNKPVETDLRSEQEREAQRLAVEDWRGVGAEENEEIQARGSVFLRRRSRALLGSLLRPYRGFI